jgi:hypothetical protein
LVINCTRMTDESVFRLLGKQPLVVHRSFRKLQQICAWTYNKIKLSRYTPWRRLRAEEVARVPVLDLYTRWGEWSASRSGRSLPALPIEYADEWTPEPVWKQRIEEKITRAGDQTQSFIPSSDTTLIGLSSVLQFLITSKSVRLTERVYGA